MDGYGNYTATRGVQYSNMGSVDAPADSRYRLRDAPAGRSSLRSYEQGSVSRSKPDRFGFNRGLRRIEGVADRGETERRCCCMHVRRLDTSILCMHTFIDD